MGRQQGNLGSKARRWLPLPPPSRRRRGRPAGRPHHIEQLSSRARLSRCCRAAAIAAGAGAPLLSLH